MMPSTPLPWAARKALIFSSAGCGASMSAITWTTFAPPPASATAFSTAWMRSWVLGSTRKPVKWAMLPLLPSALQQLLGAEVGRARHVGAHAEQGRRRVLGAAGEGDRRHAEAGQLLHGRVGADGVAGEDAEGVEALADGALDQLVLGRELPLAAAPCTGPRRARSPAWRPPPPAPRPRSRGAARPAPAPPWCRWPPRRRPPPRRSWPQKRALLRSVSSVRPPALFVCPRSRGPAPLPHGTRHATANDAAHAASGAGPPPGPRPGSRGTRARPGRRGSARPSRPGP